MDKNKGKLSVVGIGPGDKRCRTLWAEEVLAQAEVLVGYTKYIDLVQDHWAGKKIISTGMRQEIDRVEQAIAAARQGFKVALISSGDAGIYGMAGLVFEVLEQKQLHLSVEVVPGVSAVQVLAAKVGAPLMLDFACISLSDLLIPWEKIEHRLQTLAASDLVVAIYNPQSSKRTWQLPRALNIFARTRGKAIWVAVGKNLGLEQEKVYFCQLAQIDLKDIDMRTTLLIGNQETKPLLDAYLVALRGYQTKLKEQIALG